MATRKNKTEKLTSQYSGPEISSDFLCVRRPPKVQSLLTILSDLEKFSERVSEDQSHDLGGGGSGDGTQGGGQSGQQGASPRDKAISALPSAPIMRRRLVRQLERDMRKLERKATRNFYRSGKGSAYVLNELYARIRKLQALVMELLHSATEVVERLYIRVFVDRQEIV